MLQNNEFALLETADVLRSGAHVIVAKQKRCAPAGMDDLCDEEKQRFDAFENKAAARSFNHRRSLLRQVLSIASGLPKQDIGYKTGRFGKPELVNQPKDPIYFNVSQGADLCAIAICRRAEVGVDIEPEISLEAMHDVCGFLHIDERTFIRAHEDQKRAFLDVWVQKEAVAKCLGFGFSRAAESWSCLRELDRNRLRRFTVSKHRMCLCAACDSLPSLWRVDQSLA
jgi:phosphopantetheinyl transferase